MHVINTFCFNLYACLLNLKFDKLLLRIHLRRVNGKYTYLTRSSRKASRARKNTSYPIIFLWLQRMSSFGIRNLRPPAPSNRCVLSEPCSTFWFWLSLRADIYKFRVKLSQSNIAFEFLSRWFFSWSNQVLSRAWKSSSAWNFWNYSCSYLLPRTPVQKV